jgi:hypothetical protein
LEKEIAALRDYDPAKNAKPPVVKFAGIKAE